LIEITIYYNTPFTIMMVQGIAHQILLYIYIT